MKVDNSRCVDCFNCISSCKKDSLKYRIDLSAFKSKHAEKEVVANQAPMQQSRRSFIATGATVAATLPVIPALAKVASSKNKPQPITPPGSLNLERFKDMCTGCHICVVKCPSQILRPAGFQFGVGYMLRPYVSYYDSYCNYECTICSDVCPTHALKPLSVEEKTITQIGVAEFYIDRCIVNTEETDCGACSEHCPTQAVHMIPYKGTLTIPKVEPELCVGCGGCESICPVNPDRAILVVANKEHQYIVKPEEDEAIVIDDDFDFGF